VHNENHQLKVLHGRRQRRSGQTLVEYALVLSFIAVLGIATLDGLGEQIRYLYWSVMDTLASAGGGF